MGDLSEHFSRAEIACDCGCGFDTMDVETLKVADEAREFIGHPVTPTSGARCPRYNRAVGSTDKSQHIRGRAMDIPTSDPEALYAYLDTKYPNKYGIGIYDSFIHIDTRSNGPARWKG